MAPTFANVNGLNIDMLIPLTTDIRRYEIHGQGPHLVLIHGGGSSITTTFSRILPHLAERYRVLVMDLQGHGRTPARNTFSGNTIPEDAEDVFALMQHLEFGKSHVFGLAKAVINHLIISGVFCRKEGAITGFWDGFKNATLEMMPQVLRDAYIAENDDPAGLTKMFEMDCKSMMAFEDWNDNDLKQIAAKTLVLTSYQDVVTPEHALQMTRELPNAELVIMRGTHGAFLGDAPSVDAESRMPGVTAEIIHEFLSE